MKRAIFVALPNAVEAIQSREGLVARGREPRDHGERRKERRLTYRATHVDESTRVCDVLRALGVCDGATPSALGISIPPSKPKEVERTKTTSCRDLVLLGTHSQRRWRWSEPLATRGGTQETFFTVAVNLCGGGADGGSTGAEDRKAMLEMYAGDKPDAVDPKELRLAKYTTCQLSQEPLVAPVVCDDLGQLYNKEAFLNALISKTIPKALSHLSRKSVFDVELSELNGASEGIKYGCPITSLPLNGKVRFVVVRSGDANGGKGGKGGKGWVISKKAVDELKEVVREMTGEYSEVMPLYPEGEEIEMAMKKLSERLAMKKGKKRRGEDAAGEPRDGDTKDKMARTTAVDSRKNSTPPSAVQTSDTGKQGTKGTHSEVYKSIFLSKQPAGPASNTSTDFMVRGKRR